MVDLLIILFLQLLLFISYLGLFLGLVMLVALFIIIADIPKLNEKTTDLLVSLSIIMLVSLTFIILLPSNSYLSKAKTKVETSFLNNKCLKDKK